MKVIYVAGKLTAGDNFEISRNVAKAESVGMAVALAGAMPLIPHANTGLKFFGTITPEFWYEGTLELMRRCDAVILVPGWEDSTGTKAEIEEAKRLNIPVFETVAALEAWLADYELIERAKRQFGPFAMIGRNEQYPDNPLYVAVREHGDWKMFGAGATWDEAFAAVRKVKFQKADQSFVFED